MGEIKIGRMTLGMYQTNTYFLYREGSKDTILIDPADSGDIIYDKLLEKGFEVKCILLTHAHFDHIFGIKGVRERAKVTVYAFEDEKELLEDPSLNLSNSVRRSTIINADEFLKDGDTLTLCNMTFKVIHTPGHTKGGCCFYFEEAGFLVAGDTLFMESIGRSDFPTGNERTLINSIKEKLMALPDEVKVYPGHGPSTTIGSERINNPFLE